jgi:cyclopropane-fatty-acyl-phospholipid synthase
MSRTTKSRDFVAKLLKTADIELNGSRPWDLQVHNDELFNRVLHEGSLGLGEAYMDGWWDAGQLDAFFEHLLRANLDKTIKGDWRSILFILGQLLLNPQTKTGSRKVGTQHYDLGNDLYAAMLGTRKVYTCGYWKNAETLDEAQEAKLDLVCRKLSLKPGQHILDIGCGWGSFAKFAAERYGVSVTGITISKEQAKLAETLCEGLPVTILIQDYRDIQGTYDHIVSLGMFEHVGHKNYRTYMQVAHDHLADEGLFLLHTIGTNITPSGNDPWIEKYIFPHSILPSITTIGKSIENLFCMEDWHNFGPDYDRTLLAWFERFDTSWPTLQPKYGDRFYRMWKFYLLASAVTFRIRANHLWQIVLSKEGKVASYQSIR